MSTKIWFCQTKIEKKNKANDSNVRISYTLTIVYLRWTGSIILPIALQIWISQYVLCGIVPEHSATVVAQFSNIGAIVNGSWLLALVRYTHVRHPSALPAPPPGPTLRSPRYGGPTVQIVDNVCTTKRHCRMGDEDCPPSLFAIGRSTEGKL